MLSVIDPLNKEIISAVRRMESRGIEKVYPARLTAWLPVVVHERTIRERMNGLANNGHLIRYSRYGGYGFPREGNGSFDEQILEIVKSYTQRGVYKVFPHHVQKNLNVYYSRSQIGRRMGELAQEGLLVRHGYSDGYGSLDVRHYQLMDAMARAERALKEAQMLAAELAGLEYAIGEVA